MANHCDNQPHPTPSNVHLEPETSFNASLLAEVDIQPINGARDFFREFWVEFKKLWLLAGPAILTSLCQYSIAAVTLTLVGHVGNLELAALSIAISVILGFSLGILMGMGSALETLCGQAFGAGQLNMLGIYLQRSWVILGITALFLSILYVFAKPLLLAIGQDEKIAHTAGKVAVWMIPQLFAYAMYFPIAKFLQAQGKVMAMALITLVALALHTLFSWVLMFKLKWGLVGAAVMLNVSWWFLVLAQLVYIISGSCSQAWSGFSWKAFQSLWGFLKLSVASAVMLCLEVWYFTALILFAGYLKNPEVSVAALSICANILNWTIMVTLGFNIAISVRVSNELGAGHPRTAKFSVLVVVATSFAIGLLIALLLLIFQHDFPKVFSSSDIVRKRVHDLTPLLAVCIVIVYVQPVLSGVAIGAGWQAIVAYVNIGSYYALGIPLGIILGYKLKLGVAGIWWGMMGGTVVQTLILSLLTYRTNWSKEASAAEDRIREWGG